MGLQIDQTDMLLDSDEDVDFSSKQLCKIPSDILQKSGITKLYLDYNEIVNLPDQIAQFLPKLQVLSVNGNGLKQLPKSIGDFDLLKELLINENEIEYLPVTVCKLRSVEILKLTGNRLKTLPDDFGELSNLKILYSDENELEKLPPTLGLLKNIEILELADNAIKDIPPGIGQLKRLIILNLCNNKIGVMPSTFGDLTNLENVDLSGNCMENLPPYCNSVHTLRKLYVDRNKLGGIPDWVCDLTQVVELSLKDNQLHQQALSEKFGKTCKQLKMLDLSGNFMSKLPDSIGDLINLEKVHFGSVIGELERRAFQNGNWLDSIPDTFCNLVHIREIHLDENRLTDLPEQFGNLLNLEYIDLGQNVLHDLPESFGNLRSLKICLLSKNQIQLLPSSFGNLTNLEDLRLDNNLLEELPESFNKLINLKTLDLFYNRLTEVPSCIKCFTKLVRLDLDENDFKIPWYDVPQIIFKSKYPARDPNLKDNWRGRPRQDLSMMDEQIIRLNGVDGDSEDEDEEAAPKGEYYNDDLFRMACIRNMSASIWRKHGGPDKREKFVRKRYPTYNRKLGDESNSQSETDTDEESYQTSEEDNEDDDFEPPIFGAKLPSQLSDYVNKNVTGSSLIPSEENWDDEIEEVEQYTPYENFNDIYQHPAPRTLADAGYVVDSHLFLPYDIHESPISKQQINFASEDGQFDDVSEEDS